MIILINGSEKERYPRLISSMYRLRAKIFQERLGWDVTVKDGLEIDQFDDINPLYLIAVDPTGTHVRGTVRLLPTTGPNMLRDVFPMLLPKNEIIESATIWECSRFAVDPSIETPMEGHFVSEATGELMAAVIEVGLLAGLTEVMGVFDARFIRILRAAGTPPLLVSKPQKIGVCMTSVGLFEVSEQSLANIQKACGLNGSVLEAASSQRYFAA
jgi:N-acyl-L-homoserine lactone synthetase